MWWYMIDKIEVIYIYKKEEEIAHVISTTKTTIITYYTNIRLEKNISEKQIM